MAKKARRKTARTSRSRKTSRKKSSRKKSTRKKSAKKSSKRSRKSTKRKSSRSTAKRSRPRPARVKIAVPSRRNTSSQNRNILGLLLNFFFPGVGTLVSQKTRNGILQLVMIAVAFACVLTIIAFPLGVLLYLGAWVWAMVDSIKLIARS